MRRIEIRCYGELNDFLPPARRGRSFARTLPAPGSVKDAIEALGVPHTEIDLILADGVPVGFEHPVRHGDRIAVYPRFRRLDVSGTSPVHIPLPAEPCFALDGHLGRLARYLRLLGFDCSHRPAVEDTDLAAQATAEGRILLTRDLDLLKRSVVRHGYRVRSTDPRRQVAEVVIQFGLARRLDPFSRCLVCNQRLLPASPAEVAGRVPPGVADRHHQYRRCPGCARVYWPGSHHRRLTTLIEEVAAKAGEAGDGAAGGAVGA